MYLDKFFLYISNTQYFFYIPNVLAACVRAIGAIFLCCKVKQRLDQSEVVSFR